MTVRIKGGEEGGVRFLRLRSGMADASLSGVLSVGRVAVKNRAQNADRAKTLICEPRRASPLPLPSQTPPPPGIRKGIPEFSQKSPNLRSPTM